MDTIEPWWLIVGLCWAGLCGPGCTSEGAATTPDRDAVVADDAAVDVGATADSATHSLRVCSSERPDEPSNSADQGFDTGGRGGTSLCTDLADEGAVEAVVRSVSESQMTVEADSTQVTFGGWDGPALDDMFGVDETVDVALPCGTSWPWSMIQGPHASVVSLSSTPLQFWNRSVALPALPDALSVRPEFRLDPVCHKGIWFYNGLKATASTGQLVEWTGPATKEVDGWQVDFGGSEWCCRRAGDEAGGEPPETSTQIHLYRQF